jgi:hypothetical protein
MQKSALFGIRKTQNFLIGLFFRSKPRCKKIVTGGGVVQVGKKRAPQGLFLRNFTPPHEMWELIRTNFSSSERHFFACRKFCKKFRKKFDKNFMIFCQKNAPQGDLFLMTFWVLSGGHFFGEFFRKFSDNFSENFSENSSGDFLGIFLMIFEEIF